jgi:hypothetical protein
MPTEEMRWQGEKKAGYYETCKQQPLTTVNDSVPGLMFSDKAVFTSSKMACNESCACRFMPFPVQISYLDG